jgi:hypothetical protein
MARTCHTARKSISRPPVGQLAPWIVPQQQEPPQDTPLHVSQEEEPFVIELVVTWSPAAQGAPTEEQPPQQEDHNNTDNEEYSALSDTEFKKMYRYGDEVESFRAEVPVPTSRLWALLVHLGITTAPRYRIKKVPRPGWVEFKAIIEIFFGSWVLCRHQGPAFRVSHSDAVADTACQATTSWVHSNKSRM